MHNNKQIYVKSTSSAPPRLRNCNRRQAEMETIAEKQDCSQLPTPGWFLNLSSFCCFFSFNFPSNLLDLLPYVGLPGGRLAYMGRLWIELSQR